MKKLVLLAAVALFFTAGTAVAQKAPADAKIKMCNSCHKEGKNKFEEFKPWLQAMHSTVAEALDKPAAKEIAEKSKIANPKEAAECLTCHTNKFPAVGTEYNPKDIDCMTCHADNNKYHAIPEKVPHPSGKKGDAKKD